MPTQTVNLDKVERQLAELLAIIEHSSEIVIARNGEPIARLAPLTAPAKKKRIAGLNRGAIWTSDDFDATLPEKCRVFAPFKANSKAKVTISLGESLACRCFGSFFNFSSAK